MKIAIEINQQEIEEVLRNYIQETTGYRVGCLTLFVKSKQNYKLNTWETASVFIMNSESLENSDYKIKDLEEKPELKAKIECS